MEEASSLVGSLMANASREAPCGPRSGLALMLVDDLGAWFQEEGKVPALARPESKRSPMTGGSLYGSKRMFMGVDSA